MLFLTHEYLTPQQLKKIGEHKYSAQSSSIMEPVMQPYWSWLVEKMPLWLAPNLITVLGLFVNVVTCLLVVIYSPDAVTEPPRWTCLLCALGLFIYQSLDAIDGKQARRTGTSSPLGELFDHGCDAVSTIFVSIAASCAVLIGSYPVILLLMAATSLTLFYLAHWQTYVSGTLKFGKIDVTEAQFTIFTLHLVSATFGAGIWRTKLPLIHMPMMLLPAIFCVLVGIGVCYHNFGIICTGGVGKNGSTVAGTSILSPSIPLAFVLVPAYVLARKSLTGVYEGHPCLYIIAFGIVGVKVTIKLVLAHMSKSELSYLDSSYYGPGMLFLNQYFNTFIDEYIVLWAFLIFCCLDLLWYCHVVCNQICTYLNIPLFRIDPSRKQGVPPAPVAKSTRSATGTTSRTGTYTMSKDPKQNGISLKNK